MAASLTRRAALAASLLATPALAQQRRPIRLIVPFSAGGNTDAVARLVSPRVSDMLGVPVAVENRPSASTIVGVEAVARAQPDGTTILLVDTTFAVLPTLHPTLPFDIFRDFATIGAIAGAPTTLVVRRELPAQNLQAFIALARSRPGQISYATGSIGGTAHLAALLLQEKAEIRLNFIPYAGAGQAANDLVAGHLDTNFSALNAVLGLMQAGTIRALATSGAERQALAPDVPTFREQGLPDVVVSANWGLYAPTGTPAPAIQTLSDAFRRAANEDPVKAELVRRGYTVLNADPAEHARILREEFEKWGGVMRRAGAVPQR